ncbi:MAG: T9SS type A sorting domain-containing protein, partial [Ferruginibacter sp.]
LGSPATGVYTGPTGTIYTDAAATVPYTGTAINTVYVKPTATGVNNYSVVVTDGPCPSNPLIIPVTMNAPAAGTLSVSNATLCAGLNNTFAITGLTGGTSLTYQWQVSTDAGATYSNISGATSATLVQTGVTTAMSGNKYRVLVSSTGCTTTLTSSAGTLTVNPTPVVTISAAPITKLFPGLTSTLTAAVSPNAASTYQWYKNGVLVTGATLNKTVVDIDKLGTYTVRVSDVNGCVSNGVSTPASILITDSVTTNKLFIYPSPNSGQFQVRYYNAGNAPTYVNIFDEKGARVFTQTFGASTPYQSMNVDLSGFGRGIYRVDVLTANGNRINTGSVMVF